MNFSDETVSNVAGVVRSESRKNGCEVYCEHAVAKAALSSLTLADLMQVHEVRGLVEAADYVLERTYLDRNGNYQFKEPYDGDVIVQALKPFTEAK